MTCRAYSFSPSDCSCIIMHCAYGGTLKVAVHIRGESHLSVLNLNLPVEEIVEKLCIEHEEPYSKEMLGLWSDQILSNDSKFVTDANKYKIAMGSILYLKDSPTIIAEKLLFSIKSRALTERLIVEAEDGEVLNILHNTNAHIQVYHLLKSTSSELHWLIGLKFIHKLCVGHYIRHVDKSIVYNLFQFIKTKLPDDVFRNEKIIIISLRLLSALRRFGHLKYSDSVFDDLAALLLHQKHTEVQESALELLTFLVLFPNNEEDEKMATKRVVNQKIIGCICEHILRVSAPPSKAMQQQLYRYQTLVLRPYWFKKITKVLNNDKVMKLSRKLTQRAKQGELPTRRRRAASYDDIGKISSSTDSVKTHNFMSNLKASFRSFGSLKALTSKKEEKKRSMTNLMCLPNKAKSIDDNLYNFHGPIHHQPDRKLRKTSSTFYVNLTLNEPTSTKVKATSLNGIRNDTALSTKTTSELTVSCLSYQAENFAEHHRKWALTRKEDYEFVEQITNVVCGVLEIERSPSPEDPGDTFIPLVFFCYPYVFEELFCETYLLYDKTSKEMRAHAPSDVNKVLSVIEEQMRYAIHPYLLNWDKSLNIDKPATLEKMREHLHRINYRRIEKKRREDFEDRLKQDLRHKPIYVEYREKIKEHVLERIKRQRVQFARSGEYFLKVNSKGEIVKDQKTFLKVNLERKKLISWECLEDPNMLTGLQCSHYKSVPVEDLVDVSMGKESKFYNLLRHSRFSSHRSPTNMAYVVPYSLQKKSDNRTLHTDPEHWSWLLSLKMKDNSYINFCAVSLQSAHYWIDAFHIILGKPVASPAKDEELNELLDIEVRLHFLDIEMLPIPDILPKVPPLPANKHQFRTPF